MDDLVRCGETMWEVTIGGVPWRVDIGSLLNEQTNDEVIPSRASCVQRQDTVEHGVDWLPML